ncbi:MAG: deoxyguanosinetriphosphate triphosphohydrolase [bacterium]|nr:deoxyguanosinetriphosphate triphosphohydrolase [bacterium]
MLTREEYEKLEEQSLAEYAMKCRLSQGRKYKETEHDLRTAFQRDRDRILHSTAFRRLEYKTQVFVTHEGDHYRTRLTHTLEVAQIARTIARLLRLNEDLTEAIALAHDLGHTPFGHAGEEALHNLMLDHGGFEHNRHGLRVVDVLEEKYAAFPGLNLTYEVREGIVKHYTSYDTPLLENEWDPKIQPTLEAQIVDVADEIAYNNHDLDDSLQEALITESDLEQIELWRRAKKTIRQHHSEEEIPKLRHKAIRTLINLQVIDAVKQTEKQIDERKIQTLADIRIQSVKLAAFSPEMRQANQQLKSFLFDKVYRHYRVMRATDKAKRFMTALFNIYLEKPEVLPSKWQAKITGEKESPYRIVCDYIAGMTDRFAQQEYRKLFEKKKIANVSNDSE